MTYSKEYIDRAEEVILHTYNRFQIVLDKGNGVHLYDVDGKEYLDFAAGIAVFALGYNNQAYNQALKDQIDKVIHTSNLYYNVPMMEAAEKLKEKGVDAEVIDARTLVPFDKETLLNSVKKTHRLAIVSEAVRTSSFASEIAMIVSEECIDELDENIIRITSPDCPIPYSPVLEDAYVPNSDKVVEKIMELF